MCQAALPAALKRWRRGTGDLWLGSRFPSWWSPRLTSRIYGYFMDVSENGWFFSWDVRKKNNMDDDWGFPHFRKPLNFDVSWDGGSLSTSIFPDEKELRWTLGLHGQNSISHPLSGLDELAKKIEVQPAIDWRLPSGQPWLASSCFTIPQISVV